MLVEALTLSVELYGQALRGRSGTWSRVDRIVSSWIEPAAELMSELGIASEQARTHARLNLVVVRGLLLDLLATGDVRGTHETLELFVEMLEP